MDNIHSITAKVISNEKLAPEVYRLKLYNQQIANSCKPGQFVHIQCGVGRDFILRRPFSIHRKDGGGAFEVLFQVVGRGTQVLSTVKPRETLNLVGPVGRGFTIEDSLRNVLVVAGGVGIAPLVFLIDELLANKKRICVLLGSSTKERLLYTIDLKRLVRKLAVVTEDGSQGYKGLVTDILPQVIEENRPERVYACGPEGMLRQVASTCNEYKIPAQVGLERLMGCGVGACLSCVCKIKRNEEEVYRRVCIDGPVFAAQDVVWKEE